MLRLSSYLKQTNVKTEKNIMQEGGEKGFKEKITLHDASSSSNSIPS